MAISGIDNGQPFAIGSWPIGRPETDDPIDEFADYLEEATKHAEKLIEAPRFWLVRLYRRGKGSGGWDYIEEYRKGMG